MGAFDRNTETTLLSSTPAQSVSFQDGKAVDYLHVFNQFHKMGTWEYLVDRNQVFWSPEVYEIHGLKPDVGPVAVDRAIKFYHADDAKRIADVLSNAIRMKTGFRCKLRLMRADGVLRITESTAAPVIGADGKATKMIGTFRDITSQTEFENTRMAHQDLLRRMIGSLPVASALLDRNMRYLVWSNAWVSDMALPADIDLKGQSHLDVLPDIANPMRAHFEQALKGNPLGKDNERIVRDSGITHIVDWRMQPWTDKTGVTGGVLILINFKYTGAPRVAGHKDDAALQQPLKHLAEFISNSMT